MKLLLPFNYGQDMIFSLCKVSLSCHHFKARNIQNREKCDNTPHPPLFLMPYLFPLLIKARTIL